MSTRSLNLSTYCGLLLGVLAVWFGVYHYLPAAANFITYSLFSFKFGTRLAASSAFFFYDAPKVLMLLLLVVYGAGFLRSFLSTTRIKRILVGKREFLGNILAALFGIITPFCSCSAVPLFVGFVSAEIPLGVTFSFLIAAPLVNEVALGLLYGLVGWKIAALYLITGLSIAIIAGWIIGKLRMEKYVAKWVTETAGTIGEEQKKTISERHIFAWQALTTILGRVWIFILLGVAIGALIHGYVPQTLVAHLMKQEAWWTVPLAILIGIPLYSNAAGIIPIVEALLGKGVALGTVLAFMMSVIGLSFPEMVILKKVLKMRLIWTFVAIIAVGILVVGYLFNFVG